MNKSKRNPRYDLMYNAIMQLQTDEECLDFFADLCTMTELQAMEQRFHVAWLLSKGYIYNDIVRLTGASSATISRVKRSMQLGGQGYEAVFQRLRAAGLGNEEEEQESPDQD